MPDVLKAPFVNGAIMSADAVLIRLLLAFLFGLAAAGLYRYSRPASEVLPTFPLTLVLLSILIAMVTLVIGESVARAFSLVGTLSIVRFRTVVRDTGDTAFVILAVVLGMAVGVNAPMVGMIGFAVVASAAFLVRPRPAAWMRLPFLLRMRVTLGYEMDQLVGPAFQQHVTRHRLHSLETAKQGVSIDATYRVALRAEESAEQLLKALNRVDGVQGISIERVDSAEE
jgi:hypothetical protein